MSAALLTHPDCVLHEMGAGHPESPRAPAFRARGPRGARGSSRSWSCARRPRPTREQLERVHDPEHVDLVFESAPERGYAFLDPDTSMNPKSLSAALRAAGAVVAATDMVMAGEVSERLLRGAPARAPCDAARAMGFCMFNNVAIGAAHALEAHGLERVCVLDFDVHHGNGTEDAFHDDPRVMLCSTFQHPYYPVLRRRFRQRPHHQRAARRDDGRARVSARPSSASGYRRSRRTSRSSCSCRRASTRTATTRSPTSSSTTRTTAGSPSSSWKWRSATHGTRRLDARRRLQRRGVGALRGRARGRARDR